MTTTDMLRWQIAALDRQLAIPPADQAHAVVQACQRLERDRLQQVLGRLEGDDRAPA